MRVFYDPRQSVAEDNLPSPSAGKPKLLVEYWLQKKIPIEVMSFEPLTIDQLCLAHDRRFVENMLACKINNGMGNKSKKIASSLIWTNGSMVAAALECLKSRKTTISPTSSFHHACWSSAGSFCHLNGLIIAAQMCRLAGAGKVGILDLDCHYADGSEDIIQRLELNYIRHYTFGKENVTRHNAEQWLMELAKVVREFNDCDIILYNAGVDSFLLDNLGGILTEDQLRLRDRIVFRTCKEMGVPCTWSLAGGYAEPFEKVLELHTNTLIECRRVFKNE